MAMDDDMITEQIEEAVEAVNASPAMNPSRATQRNSVDFLDGVIGELTTLRNVIRDEMGG